MASAGDRKSDVSFREQGFMKKTVGKSCDRSGKQHKNSDDAISCLISRSYPTR